jgi:hypothetical protein
MIPNPLMSFVVLTWNSSGTILACIRSIRNVCDREGIACEIIVVDNGSHDGTPEAIKRAFGHDAPLRLIELAENRGTTLSRNLALKDVHGSTICVMDSDAEIIGGRLSDISAMLEDRSVGIVAPRLVLPDGTIQRSVKRYPSALGKLMKIPQIIFRLRPIDLDAYSDFPFREQRDVDTAISACWFLRKELLDDVGYLDERIFYSPEDIDYCIRVRKQGKRIVYDPHFHVLHHTQQITHRNVISRHAISHFMGLVYLFRKHRYITAPRIGR